MSLYSVKKLSYTYPSGGSDNGEALRIPRLEIEEGAISVLLGPNGSGKTTLLKILNRLILPNRGTIEFKGIPIHENGEVRRDTVYVHQNPLLFSGNVYSNVAYGLKLRGYSHGDTAERTARSLEIVGLEGLEKRRSSALSGGEAQRVAIARALAVEPKVLLLDEPTSSVDRNSIGKLEELLHHIRRDYGCSIIISTHNLPFAYRMGDRLISLEEGRLVPTGQNILKGHLEPGKEGYRLFHVDSPEGALSILSPDVEGEHSKAVIDYDRILLSKKPLHSSAQNSFRATVTAVEPASYEENSPHIEDNHLVDVCTEVNGVPITSRITRKSLRELELEVGREVCIAFKASSVRLY